LSFDRRVVYCLTCLLRGGFAAFVFFFFQAEDGIRDFHVTGVQTCALPIWKTGTSYGKRDAWSIGYNKKYTVGVWVGNFSGTGVPELSGANIATPLLFDIFNTIDYNASSSWFTPPSGLELRKVCAHTGDVPGEGCDEIIHGEVIPGVSIFKRCEHSKPVFVHEELTVSYCGYCLPPSGTVRKHFPNFEPELIAFYNYSKIPFPKI